MMKSKITKTLALAAAVFGLQAFTNTVQAATTYVPKILINFGNDTATSSDSWTCYKETGAGGNLPATAYSKEGRTFQITGGGNFFPTGRDKFDPVTNDFQPGTYTDVFGVGHTSLLEEMAASLGVADTKIDSSIYNTGEGNGGYNNHTGTIGGLDTTKKYVVYYVGGMKRGDSNSTSGGFQLQSNGYGSGTTPQVDYVTTVAVSPATVSTSYQSLSDITTNLKAGENGLLLVRVSNIKPNSEGKIIFKPTSVNKTGINCLAVAEEAEAATDHAATASGTCSWSTLSWDPAWVSGATHNANITVSDTATLTVDAAQTMNKLTVTSDANKLLTFKNINNITATTIDFSAANGKVDLGLDPVEDLAKYAVVGAPYSYWFFKGVTVTGEGNIKLPTMPTGYNVTLEKVSGYGCRFVVTAPVSATFGAVSVNLRNGNALSSGSTLSGAYPVAHDNWGDLQASANNSKTVDGVTFTIGSDASAYGIDTYSDEIYRQYMDDSSTTRTISLSGISYDKYRIIVYFSTDTADYNFRPMIVNDGASDVAYSGPSTGTTGGHTVKGRNDNWGHSGPNKGMNAMAEGVNYLVTDVMTTKTPVLKFTRTGGSGPRATPCAIQVVKVGQAVVTYEATVTQDCTWSDLWPSLPPAGASVELIRSGDATDATVTIDETVSLNAVTVVSASGKNLTLTPDSGATFAATTYDFTGAAGAVTVPDTGSATVTLADSVVITQSGSTLTKTVDNAITVNGSTLTVVEGSPTFHNSTLTSLTASGKSVTLTGDNTITDYALGVSAFTVASGSTTFPEKKESDGKYLPAFTINEGATAAFPSLPYSWNYNLLTVNGTLNVTGMLGFQTGNKTISVDGTGTINCGEFKYGNISKVTLNCARVNIGSSGITKGTEYGCTLTFKSGLVIGATANWSMVAAASATLNGALTFDTAGHTVTINGTLTGSSGALTKTGEGTLSLAGASAASYSGATTISAGTLQVAENKLAGDVSVASGATLNITGTAGQDEYVITATGKTVTNNGTVQLNGTEISEAGYQISGNKLIKLVPTATISESTSWSQIQWQGGTPKAGGDVILTVTAADATVTLDTTISLGTVTVTSEANKNVTLTPGSGKTFAATTYDFTGAAGKVTLGYGVDTATVKAGTDSVVNSVTANTTINIGSGKKLTVKGGTVVYSKTTNNGTLNFEGGDATTPINYTADGDAGVDLGTMTLAASTYVKLTPNGNKLYTVTGQGADTSTLEIASDAGRGMAADTQFRSLKLIANAGGNGFWIEKAGSVDATVDIVATQNVVFYSFNPTIGTLSGSGKIDKNAEADRVTVTITPHADATFSGTSSHAFVIAEASGTQTLSGAFDKALTVNAGGKVKLTGDAQPSSTTSAGYVEVAAGKLTGNVTLTGGTLNITTDTTGQQSYTITEGTFTQGSAAVQLNGTPIADLGYVVKDNKIIKPFEATIDGDKTWSELWTGTAPGTDDAVLLTVTAAATLTINDSTTVASIKVTSETGSNKLTIASPTNLHATTYDFSSAAGKVAFDYTGITTTTTLLSGTITGGENIDTTGVPEGSSLIVTPTEIRLVFNGRYQKFNYGTVYSWATTGSSAVDLAGASDFYEFDIVALTNMTTLYHGSDTTTGTAKFWHRFAYATSVNEQRGAIIRLQQGSYCTTIGGTYGAQSFGGIIAEPGGTNYTIEQTSGTRDTVLGDPKAAVNTFFDIGANVTFNRNGKLALAGTLTFDIASGKTFNLNASQTSKTLELVNTVAPSVNGNYGTTTPGGTLVMKGEGTLQVNNLKAEGSTLDYTNIPLSRQTAYISGTLTINDSTVIMLPADLPKETAFKMATTLSGATDGNRTIYLGNEAVLKDVTFNASEGTISYADVTTYVAKINETEQSYATLAEALTAVQNNQTITLLMNCSEHIETAKTFTFVPAGFTYGGAVTVNQGGVLTIDGGDACTIASVVTLNNGGKLITKGTLSLSNGSNVANNGSALEVATGTLTYECGEKKLSANIVIRKDATYVQGTTVRTNDQFDYANAHTVDVYGTLNLAGSRWSVKNNTTINLYPGALIEGNGESTYGAIDAADTTVSINVKKNGSEGGTATISAKLRPRGNPGFAYNVEEDMTLVLNGSLGDKYNGFRKEGAGTLLISAAYATTGQITLAGGTVKIGNAGALGTSPIAFAGGTLDLNGQTLTDKTASGDGTITNTSDTQASYNGIPVPKDAGYTVEGGAIAITLGDSDEITLSTIPAANAVKFHGSGKVIYNNTVAPLLPTGIWASDWTGTFKYEGLNGSTNNWNWSSYYNGTLSKFEFAGNMTGGYLPRLALSFGELILTGTIKTDNGYTLLEGDKEYVHYDFTKLSGSGTFNSAVTTSAKPIYWFKDASEFTGTFTSSGSSGGMRFVLGSEAGGEYSGTVPAERAVSFAGEVTLNKDVTFNTVGGVVAQSGAVITIPAGVTAPKSSTAMTFEGGSSVVLADKDSKLAVGAAVTVASDVTIPVKLEDATGLAAGKELITWTSQPAGSFSFSVESGVKAGDKGFKATKGESALAVAVDDTTTYYEVGPATERQPTVFEDQWLTDAGVKAETTAKTQENLDTPNQYGVKPSDAYLMGYAASAVETAAVVLNQQPASLSDKIRLVIQGVPAVADRRNGAVVTYTVKTSTSPTMEDPEERDIGESTMVDMGLPESGVFYYQVEATIDISGTQSEPIPAVVPAADIVDPGMPLLTEPGAKFAAALGTTTVTEATASMTFQLGGAGVYEGQEYHLEVNETNESPLQTKSLKLTTSSVSASNEAYGMVAKVLSDKTVTFDFGHEVGVGTTCKLTLIGEGGAANGNVVVKSPAMTGTTANMEEVIVSARMGFLPYEDGIATAQAPDMPQQYRIPAIATDGQGEVIACYDCRYGKSDLGATWNCSLNSHGTVFSGIDIAENYSSDNGKTFSESYLAVDVANMRDQTGAWIGGYANRNNGNYIVKERDIGDVCVLFDPAGNGGDGLYWMMGITGGGLSTTGTGGDKVDVVLYTRERGPNAKWVEWNNGKGSTDPLQYRSVKWQILDSLGVTTATLGQGFLEGPGHGIVTTKACTIKGANVPAGTLVFPIQCFLSGGTKSGAAYSTDHGATWKATALTDTDSAPQENCVMELDDGTWYMCCKCNSAGYYRTYRYNHSTDAWVKVENGAPCPASREGSCLRMGVGSDGKGRYAICHARNDRANIVVYFGVDTTTSGETPSTTNKGIQWDWDNYITIHKENTNGGYSSMCMVDDTTLGILYESSYGAADDGGTDTSGCRMYFTRIDVSDKVVGPTAK